LIDYISAFSREFLDIARIGLRTDIARDIPDLSLGAPQRHSVFLAIREVLNNIVKHAGATEVLLEVELVEEVLCLRIQDNGRGFDLEYASSGNGLENLRMRMREAGGECEIQTSRRSGTSIILSLPLPRLSKPVL
jgi:signal transduction histidine kinase